MSKRDFFHNAVCAALEKEDWDITDDPLQIKWGGATIKIDIGA
ncbi:MAG: element excision factor XisH family protein, partial [Chloroflexota bacterium]